MTGAAGGAAGGVGRVVVTGASGMLGGWVARRLREAGCAVSGVDVRLADDHTDVPVAVADVRDAAAVTRAFTGVDAVVHCAAALPSYPEDEIRSVIVDGTRTVLTAARDAGVARVVHISTTAVYGLPTVVPTTEEHPRTPVDAYGRAKAAAEEVCEKFRADGLCVPILRPKTFLGPGRMGLFAMLFEWAEEGRHFPVLGRGDVRTQMCAVTDLAECVLVALRADRSVADDTFNVAAAEFGSLREDFQAVLDAAGHGRRVVSLPARPAVAALHLLQRAGLSPVYGRLVDKLTMDSYVSTDKVRERLGFAPRLSNREALLSAYEWWRRERPGGARTGRTAQPGGTGRTARTGGTGRTSRDAWSQGALRAAKVFF